MARQGAVGRQGEILAQFEAAISGMRPREIQEALRQMLDARPAPVFEPAPEARVAHQAEGADWAGADRTGADRPEADRPEAGRTGADRAPSPSRRQPRRPDIVTYQVRVDLAGTEPPLWRRLDLASDLFLDELHEVIQTAFGWTDSHLHRFSAGLDFYDDGAEHYLCPDDTAEGEPGVPEEQVRLDELLAEAGDELFYAYDFGDGWEHALRLEAVLPRDCRAPRAVCTGGRRPGPAEDCGGPAGYELIAAAADPDHPDHEDAVTEFARTFGDGIDPAEMSTTPFDQDAINGALACFGSVAGGLVSGSSAAGGGSAAGDGDGDGADLAGLPRPLTELADAVRTPSAKRQLLRLLGHANLAQPAEVDAATAARMVHPYTWLLNRVGDDGIKLTDAGHLPPSHVKAALAELDLPGGLARPAGPGGWGQRENQTAPMLHLRESAQALGLLRKHRGRLVRTARGAALRDDPAALWRYLAERMPFGTARSPEVQAGLVLLICVAAGCTGTLDRTIARTLTAIGWINGDGSPLTPGEAAEVTGRTRMTLRRLSVLPPAPGTDAASDMRAGAAPRPGPDGMAFARATLLTWAYPV